MLGILLGHCTCQDCKWLSPFIKTPDHKWLLFDIMYLSIFLIVNIYNVDAYSLINKHNFLQSWLKGWWKFAL